MALLWVYPTKHIYKNKGMLRMAMSNDPLPPYIIMIKKPITPLIFVESKRQCKMINYIWQQTIPQNFSKIHSESQWSFAHKKCGRRMQTISMSLRHIGAGNKKSWQTGNTCRCMTVLKLGGTVWDLILLSHMPNISQEAVMCISWEKYDKNICIWSCFKENTVCSVNRKQMCKSPEI